MLVYAFQYISLCIYICVCARFGSNVILLDVHVCHYLTVPVCARASNCMCVCVCVFVSIFVNLSVFVCVCACDL